MPKNRRDGNSGAMPILFDGSAGALTLEQFSEEIDRLSENADERGEAILGQLYDYAEQIAPEI